MDLMGKRLGSSSSIVDFINQWKCFSKNLKMIRLDLSWEFPSARGGRPEDRRNFAALIRELREALQSRSLLLVTSLSANKWTIDSGYDVPSIAQ